MEAATAARCHRGALEAHTESSRHGTSTPIGLIEIGCVSALLVAGMSAQDNLSLVLLSLGGLVLIAIRESRHSCLGVLSPLPLFATSLALYSLPLGATVLAGWPVVGLRAMLVFSPQFIAAIQLHHLALATAILAYRLTRAQAPLPEPGRWTWSPSRWGTLASVVLLGVGALALVIMVWGLGGPATVLASDYGSRFARMRGLGILLGGLSLALVGSVVLFAGLLRRKASASSFILLWLAIGVITVGWTVLTERRRFVLEVLLGFLVLWVGHRGRVARRWWVIGLTSLLAFGLLLGVARGGAGFRVMEVVRRSPALLNPANGELSTAILTTTEILEVVPTRREFARGATLADAIRAVVPSAVWPERPTAVAQWYVREFYPRFWEEGGGLAFSLVAESYLNFGLVGVVGFGLACGVLLRRIERALRTRGFAAITLFALAAPWLFVWPRLDSASVLKGLVVGTVTPALVVLLAGRMSARESR